MRFQTGLMRQAIQILLSSLAVAVVHSAISQTVTPGVYTNEEQVYFTREAGAEPPPWLGLRIFGADGEWRFQRVDRYGGAIAEGTLRSMGATISFQGCKIPSDSDAALVDVDSCALLEGSLAVTDSVLRLTLPNGDAAELRAARPFTCWVTVLREQSKSDGSEDWLFVSGLPIHDQGGRLQVGGDSGAREVVIALRNVVWPEPSRNRPSLVLYVFEPPALERAVSYAWADPEATRIGINLRWMQASCTRDSY